MSTPIPTPGRTVDPAGRPAVDPRPPRECHVRYGVYPACPLCGGDLHPEHAHYKCGSCGWRDSCCD